MVLCTSAASNQRMGALEAWYDEYFVKNVWDALMRLWEGRMNVKVKVTVPQGWHFQVIQNEIFVLIDRKTPGYAFVHFESPEAAKMALLYDGTPMPGWVKVPWKRLFRLRWASRG